MEGEQQSQQPATSENQDPAAATASSSDEPSAEAAIPSQSQSQQGASTAQQPDQNATTQVQPQPPGADKSPEDTTNTTNTAPAVPHPPEQAPSENPPAEGGPSSARSVTRTASKAKLGTRSSSQSVVASNTKISKTQSSAKIATASASSRRQSNVNGNEKARTSSILSSSGDGIANKPAKSTASINSLTGAGNESKGEQRDRTPPTIVESGGVDGDESNAGAGATAELDEITKRIRAGTVPLFLTGTTQELFRVKGGEDVTAKNPFKMIPKADILSDIQARLAISDFHPVKQQIIDFPQDQILLHYDPDFKYGQNFFVAITPDAVDAILNPVVEAPKSNEPAAPVKPPQRKWECLGSDKEIEAEQVIPTRAPIHVIVSRKRREFNASCRFGDRDANDGFTECRPYKDANYEITRMELNVGVQAVPTVKDALAQTTWNRPLNFSCQYEPIQYTPEEQAALAESDEVVDAVRNAIGRIEKALLQNQLVDIFKDDYQELGEDDVALEQGHASLQEYQSFTDLKHSVVAVSCCHRMTYDEKFEIGFKVRSKQSLILIWSFHDPIHPQLILEAPDDIHCFQFNPHDPNVIAGGCINGQIVLWDITDYQDKLKSTRKNRDDKNGMSSASAGSAGKDRQTDAPIVHWVAVSSIELSHKGPISDVLWLPKHFELSHTGELIEGGENGHRELVTASLDGSVCFWDTRYKKDLKSLDLTWKPFMRVPLSAMDNTFDYGITRISIRTGGQTAEKQEKAASAAGGSGRSSAKSREKVVPSKFFCATEEGDLIASDWIAEKGTEEKGQASRVEYAFPCHFGPMSDLQRSPFFPDIVLSVGGWSFHIWREGVATGPLISSAPSAASVVSGRWSPTRPAVFFISKSDGTVEVWDLLDKSHAPSLVGNVSSNIAISSMAVKQYIGGAGKSLYQFVAAGDDGGTLHIIEVPRNLTRPTKNERAIVRGFFDREVKRLNYVQERKKLRAQEKAAFEAAALEAMAAAAQAKAAPAAGAKPEDVIAAPAVAIEDEDEKMEKEYLKMERNFLELEGLIPAEV
ncbi:WD repeat-containing protein 63 [Quaeritorhiza haematococci]|nr:WD repeat-containing protein 63 [Quaeritorhiza haematococci]